METLAAPVVAPSADVGRPRSPRHLRAQQNVRGTHGPRSAPTRGWRSHPIGSPGIAPCAAVTARWAMTSSGIAQLFGEVPQFGSVQPSGTLQKRCASKTSRLPGSSSFQRDPAVWEPAARAHRPPAAPRAHAALDRPSPTTLRGDRHRDVRPGLVTLTVVLSSPSGPAGGGTRARHGRGARRRGA
jgi:hypothetical protein